MKTFDEIVVGDVVRVVGENGVAPVNLVGVVYNRYRFASYEGVSVIFETGQYDGWSQDRFDSCLVPVLHCASVADYRFRGAGRVASDFDQGRFSEAFRMVKSPAGNGENSLLW